MKGTASAAEVRFCAAHKSKSTLFCILETVHQTT
jgi:hypothetical protein